MSVEERLTNLYNSFMEKPNIIYGVFKNFFGEEFVDMQNYPSLDEYINNAKMLHSEEFIMIDDTIEDSSFSRINILVRFPEVRIINENDKYIDIWELYARVTVTYSGTMRGDFRLNRSEYDLFQLRNGYMHSHISSIPFSRLTEFQSPCLGSGPIRGTIATLNDSGIEFDELRWELFCLELSKYVQVESLTGGPYHRLEELGDSSMRVQSVTWPMYRDSQLRSYSSLNTDLYKDFMMWLLRKKKLKFDFLNGYGIGMSYIQWTIFISNEFIEWYNIRYKEGVVTASYRELLLEGLLYRGVLNNNKIYTSRYSAADNYFQYVGRQVCIFKGEPVLFKIREGNTDTNDDNMSTFLAPVIVEHFYKCILEIVNYEYRNETQTTGTDKKVYFI